MYHTSFKRGHGELLLLLLPATGQTDTDRGRETETETETGGRLEGGNDEPKEVAVLATLLLFLLQLQRRSPRRWTRTA